MFQHLFVSALFALAVATAATAQENPARAAKRGAYVVKYAAAKDLAGVLARHFKGAADIQAVPESTGNYLLVNAPPPVFDEVVRLLDQLDRRPQPVVVELFVIELPAAKGAARQREPGDKYFAGPLDDMAAKIEGLQKKGAVAGVTRIQLTGLDGQPASLTLGEMKPVVRGIMVTAGGRVSRSISYQNVGTIVRVTPQVVTDKAIRLDLHMEDTRVHSSDSLPAIGADEQGKPIRASAFDRASLDAKLLVTSGQAVLARDTKVAGESGAGRTLLVVGARVVEPDARSR